MFWPNLVLTGALMAVMISGKVEPVVVFMVGLVLAVTIIVLRTSNRWVFYQGGG